jgi:hypothetical protein
MTMSEKKCIECGAPGEFPYGEHDWICGRCLVVSMHTPECMALNEAENALHEVDEYLKSGGQLQ